MTDLSALEAAAERATPGPWRVGERYDFAGVMYEDGTCSYCEMRGEPEWVGRLDINGTVMEAHGHPASYPDDHLIYQREAPFDKVAGNYDYEEGGIVRPADAAFIALADPPTVAALCGEVRALRGALEEALDVLDTALEDGNIDQAYEARRTIAAALAASPAPEERSDG